VARKQRTASSSATTPARTRDPNLPVIRPEVPAYVLDFYVDSLGNIPARDWLRSLELRKKFVAGHVMQTQLQQDGLGVCKTRWGKNLAGGLGEFRVNEASAEGEAVLRIFFHAFGDRRILILHGYDKGEDSSAKRQQREISEARRRLKDFEARMRAGSYPLRELPPTAGAAERAQGRKNP
jgi:phage-related protein